MACKKKSSKEDNEVFEAGGLMNIVQSFSKKVQRENLSSLCKIEFLSTVKKSVFLVLTVIGILITGFVAYQSNQKYGTPFVLLTPYMVVQIAGVISLFSVIILSIYAGEAVHRTRKNKTFELYDTLPVSNSALYLSKITALVGVSLALTLLVILIGILYQTFNGYFNYELGMYFTYNFSKIFPGYLFTLLLAFFIHVLINNKFLGHFIVVAIYIGVLLLMTLAFKISNPLEIFGEVPSSFLSDSNGFGHYLYGEFWLNLYWILFTCILAGIGKIFWNRGFFLFAKERCTSARQRLTGKTIAYTLLVVVAFISVGTHSFYNLKILNQFEDGDCSEKLSADSEED